MDDRSAFPPAGKGWASRAPKGLPTTAEVLGRAGGENFPVALRALPAELRRDLLALYGFARLADQLGDAYPGDRSGALDWLEHELDGAMAGTIDDAHPLVARMATTAKARHLDPQPLHDLVQANRLDQITPSYDSFNDLEGYCRLSANSVGRSVLGIFERSDPQRIEWSDAICTGLQLAEHWNDVAEDAAVGRVYIPREDLVRFRIGLQELSAEGPARPALRALMAFEVDRARRFIERGTPLVASLHGWARLAIGGFVGGGLAALDGLADADFDPLRGAPRRSTRRIATRSVAAWIGPHTKQRRGA